MRGPRLTVNRNSGDHCAACRHANRKFTNRPVSQHVRTTFYVTQIYLTWELAVPGLSLIRYFSIGRPLLMVKFLWDVTPCRWASSTQDF
jgi:hypothetical protein